MERDSKIDVTTASGNISTHTLTWSVTDGIVMFNSDTDFNSHAHVERDRGI